MHTAGHHGEWTTPLLGQHPAPQEQVTHTGLQKLCRGELCQAVQGELRQSQGSGPHLCLTRFGDGYMITVRTKSSQNVKDVVRFFNRNFPEAMLKVVMMEWSKGEGVP